jgi:Tfp pilus assembly protein PilF
LACLLASALMAQAPHSTPGATADPVYDTLSKAFAALRSNDYDSAVALFRKAVEGAPGRTDIHKNLAYTLLKTGDNEAARHEFGEAMRIDPNDFHVALEYAFLCFEAKDEPYAHKAEARRIFARIRDTGDAESRRTAAAAFENIDAPLRAGIERWKQALAAATPTFSAYFELATLAEQRDELELAATHYRAAFRLQPRRRSVLLDLARVERARGNGDAAMAALIAASHGSEPRTSELAREQMPERYPYVYEFRNALELDPGNGTLHRELAYLLLSMSEKGQTPRAEAEKEFEALMDTAADDYLAAAQLGLLYLNDKREDLARPILERVIAHAEPSVANRARAALRQPAVLEKRAQPETASPDIRQLAERSYQLGYLKDALRYYLQLHEQNPGDASIALKLGQTYNMLHDDMEAWHWFDIARQGDDAGVAAQARAAYENLRPNLERVRTTVWAFPLYSSRWSDLFGYGQVKAELRLGKLPFRPYASVRFVGDARRSTGGVEPQNLSESSFILGAGVASRQWHGAMGWFEAGSTISYLTGTPSRDFRGGISFSRNFGKSMAAESNGWFNETTADSVFISRFDNDFINYAQNRTGYTSEWAGFKVQTFWANNLTFDVKRQYWANFVETGPGVRFHPPGTPKSLWIQINPVRGVYLVNQDNPRRPNFMDFRVGVWYAFTR